MVKRPLDHGRTELLFSLLLFFVFLLCSIFTILIGSRVYENIRDRNNDSFYRDTALSYVANKVRQEDETGAVEVRDEGGTSVLVLTSEINGGIYETWIYTLNGTLRELFTPKDSGLTVADGLEISQCPALSFSLEEKNGKQMLSICQQASGDKDSSETGTKARSLSLLLRSSDGAFPAGSAPLSDTASQDTGD